MTLRIGSVCTGYGGLDEAVQQVFGGELAWVSDIDPGACQIIDHRMPGVPNIGDLRFTHWARTLRQHGPIDVLCGGYPCQPFSTAGNRKGTDDARHLWPFIAGALRVLRPRLAIFENVANHLRIGFDTVLCDLADLGFDAEWCLVQASEIGAPHPRKRLFLLATAADPADLGHERGRGARHGGHGPTHNGQSAAHAERVGSGNDSELPAGRDALRDRVRDDTPRCGAAVADADAFGQRADVLDLRKGQPDVEWGDYEPAIRRWETLLGRSAPCPTDALGRLTPVFTEWMMGLPDGWVTCTPGLTKNAMGKALGNGVVPQQAAAALRLLADRAGLLRRAA